MKILALLFLAGCSHTEITSKWVTLKTQANIKNFTASASGFHFDDLNHSVPTLAGGKAISNGATAFGTAATGLATGLLAHGL
jgi:hypothetical protein